jgi:hypothetical protein
LAGLFFLVLFILFDQLALDPYASPAASGARWRVFAGGRHPSAAARDGRILVRAGMEEWLRRGPNKRMPPIKS